MQYRLSDLKTGQKGRIINFTETDMLLKLLEMGCLPGEIITIEQVAPLKGPISISVAGYVLSLRKAEADDILVELVDNITA